MLDSVTMQFNARQFARLTPKFERFFTRGQKTYDIGPKGNSELCTIQRLLMDEKTRWSHGGYFPKVKVQTFPFSRSPFNIRLILEFSVPKFLFGTNFYEFSENDLPALSKKLHSKLWDVGISLNTHEVPTGIVTRLDYCKNFLLPPAVSGHRFFDTIKQYQIKGKGLAEFNYTKYSNGNKGELVNFFLKSQNLRIYEKVQEVKYRASTELEKMIAKNPPCEAVPRIELALHDTTTFKTVMSKARSSLGLVVKDEYTVTDLFKQRISQKILTSEWRDVVDPASVSLIACAAIDDDIAFSFILNFCQSYEECCVIDKIRRDVQAIGQKNAYAKFKKDYTQYGSEASFYRLQSDVKDALRRINLPNPTPSLDVLRLIKTQLKQFDLLRPPSAQPKLVLSPPATVPIVQPPTQLQPPKLP
jgi:hypothetical protein